MSDARGRRTSYLSIALTATVALGLGACNSSSPANRAKVSTSSRTATASISAGTLYQQLRSSSAAAKSVRIRGTLAKGSPDKTTKIQIDIAGDRAGKSSRVTANDGSGSVEILTTGGKSYLKADAVFWTKNGSEATARLAAGKYVEVPAGSAAAIGGLTVGKLLDKVFAKDLSAVGKLNSTVKTAELNGAPAFLMTTKLDGTRIYASTDSQARLLRVEGGRPQPTRLDFTQWDAVPPTSPPAADEMAKIPGL